MGNKDNRKGKARLKARVEAYEDQMKRADSSVAGSLRRPGSQNRKK